MNQHSWRSTLIVVTRAWALCAAAPTAGGCTTHLLTIHMPESRRQELPLPDGRGSVKSGSEAEDVQSPAEILEESIDVLVEEAVRSIAEP